MVTQPPTPNSEEPIYLSILLITLVFGGNAIVLLISDQKTSDAIENSHLIQESIGTIFETSHLTRDYLFTHSDRTVVQWREAHRRVGALIGKLSSHPSDYDEENIILRRIQANHVILGALFNKITTTMGSGGISEIDAERVIEQSLYLRTSILISDAHMLSNINNQSIAKERRSLRYMLVFSAATSVIFTLFIVFINRRIVFAEEHYRSLFNNAEIAMFRTRLDGSEVLDCNTKFLEMLGYSRDEVIGVPSRILWVAPTERDKMVLQLQAEGRVSNLEFQMLRKGGDVRWCVTSVRLFKEDGVLEGSVQDITERKQAELEVLNKNAALERSNADLEQFAYVASHDLQTPLRNIVRYAQLLEHRYKNRLDADADDFIGFVVDSGKHMTRLINDLLEFSRVSRQSEPLKPISAGEALAQALKNLDLELVTTGAEVKVGDLPMVQADQTYLVSLFQNLLGNGLKYRAPDRKPMLSVSAERVSFDCWRFAIADNGIGIEPQYHDKIFEIFQRLNPAASAEGTGIGLTLCRRIVHRFGGNIWLKSEPGTGTTFFFTLTDGTAAT